MVWGMGMLCETSDDQAVERKQQQHKPLGKHHISPKIPVAEIEFSYEISHRASSSVPDGGGSADGYSWGLTPAVGVPPRKGAKRAGVGLDNCLDFLARIKVGAQIVPRHTRRPLDRQNDFRSDAAGAKHVRDVLLGTPYQTSQPRLAAGL